MDEGIGRPVEILLVEDNPGDVRLTEEALKEGRVINNIHLAKDGVEAMSFLQRGGEYSNADRPDLILLDLNLPDSKELSTLDSVRENAHEVPIVVITALSDEGLALEAMKRGAEGFLVKGQMGVNAL